MVLTKKLQTDVEMLRPFGIGEFNAVYHTHALSKYVNIKGAWSLGIGLRINDDNVRVEITAPQDKIKTPGTLGRLIIEDLDQRSNFKWLQNQYYVHYDALGENSTNSNISREVSTNYENLIMTVSTTVKNKYRSTVALLRALDDLCKKNQYDELSQVMPIIRNVPAELYLNNCKYTIENYYNGIHEESGKLNCEFFDSLDEYFKHGASNTHSLGINTVYGRIQSLLNNGETPIALQTLGYQDEIRKAWPILGITYKGPSEQPGRARYSLTLGDSIDYKIGEPFTFPAYQVVTKFIEFT